MIPGKPVEGILVTTMDHNRADNHMAVNFPLLDLKRSHDSFIFFTAARDNDAIQIVEANKISGSIQIFGRIHAEDVSSLSLNISDMVTLAKKRDGSPLQAMNWQDVTREYLMNITFYLRPCMAFAFAVLLASNVRLPDIALLPASDACSLVHSLDLDLKRELLVYYTEYVLANPPHPPTSSSLTSRILAIFRAPIVDLTPRTIRAYHKKAETCHESLRE
jgi:hypothetical protein